MNLQMFKDENEEQFIWRLGQYKDSGVISISWDEIANIVNKEIGNDDSPLSESAYRKAYQQAKRFYNAGVFDRINNKEYLEELKTQRQELAKQQVKVRDERNELNRIIREEARKESYKEQFLRSITEHDCKPLLYDESKRFTGVLNNDNDLICTMFDVHTGIEINNYFNRFNEDILKDRINAYLDKIFEVQLRHGSENIYVILSELVSGLIHPTLRIENNQNLIEQFLTITDYVSQFLTELSYRFNEVHAFICPGNHSRVSPKKEESMRNENMDLLVIPFLEAKLQNFGNIEFHENKIDSMIAMFNVRGQKVFAVHGDKTTMNNVVEKLTLYIGMRPDIIYSGHMHTNAMVTKYDVKCIQAGCFSGGSDEYCMNKMLRNKPEQVISVITDDGLDCNYDVKL